MPAPLTIATSRALLAPDARLAPGWALWLDYLTPGALWADVARTTPAPIGVNSVASWYDPTTGRAVAQPTAGVRPDRTATGVYFGSGLHYLYDAAFVQAGAYTIILVETTGTSIPANQAAAALFASGSARWACGANAAVAFRHGWGSTDSSIGLASPAMTYATGTRYLRAYRKDASGWRIAVRSAGATVSGAVGDASAPASAPQLTIGAEYNGSVYAYGSTSTLQAALIYARALSDAELSAATLFLVARHGAGGLL